MKYLGVGLSKTGTTSLHEAFQLLGLKSIHWDKIRLNDILDGTCKEPDFRRYDDVDAVFDLPSVFFWRELLAAYPNAKAILTLRDEETWWKSIEHHFNVRIPSLPPHVPFVKNSLPSPAHNFNWSDFLSWENFKKKRRFKKNRMMRERIRILGYGSDVAIEYIYKKAYRDHYQAVRNEIPADRLLEIDITKNDGWDKLCSFMEIDIPEIPFPHHNRR